MALPRRIAVGNCQNFWGHFSKICDKNGNFFGIVLIFLKKRSQKNKIIDFLKNQKIAVVITIILFFEFFIIKRVEKNKKSHNLLSFCS